MKIKKYTFIEIIIVVSIISIFSLVLINLFYTGTFFSYKGLNEVHISNNLERRTSQLSEDFKNSKTQFVEENSIALKMDEDKIVYYNYKDSILYRNGIAFMKNVDDITFQFENNLLIVRMKFKNEVAEMNIPYNIYVYKPS